MPFLELDDATVIAESMTICRYIEELRPEPSLFGRTPRERVEIDMWCRRIELDGFLPMLHAVRNHVPMFSGRVIPGTRSDRLSCRSWFGGEARRWRCSLAVSSRTWRTAGSWPVTALPPPISSTSSRFPPPAWSGWQSGTGFPRLHAGLHPVPVGPRFNLQGPVPRSPASVSDVDHLLTTTHVAHTMWKSAQDAVEDQFLFAT